MFKYDNLFIFKIKILKIPILKKSRLKKGLCSQGICVINRWVTKGLLLKKQNHSDLTTCKEKFP
jgi:hypothetical protein